MSKSFGIDDAQKFVDEHYFDNTDIEIGVRIDSLKLTDGIMDFDVEDRPKKCYFYTGSVLSSLETNVAIEKETQKSRLAAQKRQKELELFRIQESIRNREQRQKKIEQEFLLKELQKKREELLYNCRGKALLYTRVRLFVNPDYDILATTTHCCLPSQLSCRIIIEINTIRFNAFCIEEQLLFIKFLEKEWGI